MRWIVAVATAFLLLLPQFAWGQTQRARVGMKTVGSLEIALYVWRSQEIVHPKGIGHPEPKGGATNHLDVQIYDLRRAIYVPYLNVKATIGDPMKREFGVELNPMIGEWIHYGANVTLPHPGR